MIGWIAEQDRRQAVLLHERRVMIELLHQECSIYQAGGVYHMKLPYGCTYIRHPQIEHQSVTEIADQKTGETATVYWSMYDRGYGEFHHYAWKTGFLSIGSAIDDDIYVQDINLKPRQFLIDTRNMRVIDQTDSGMGDLSGRVVSNSSYSFGERFRVLNVQIILCESFLAVSSASNTYCRLEPAVLSEQQLQPVSVMQYLHRSFQISSEPFHYEAELREPLPAETNRKRPLVFVMGPALMMSSASLTAGLMSAYNGWLSGRSVQELLPMILLPSVMVLSALLWNPLQRIYDNRNEKRQLRRRQSEYEEYMHSLQEEILSAESEYITFLNNRFPLNFADPDQLWRALPDQPDSFCIRIGTGEVTCDVRLNQNFKSPVNDPIPEMIEAVRSRTAVQTMPVLVRLNSCRYISVSYAPEYRDYLIGLLFQLLFYHGPDVLHVVFLVPHEIVAEKTWICELPHVSNGHGQRSIASTISEAAEISSLIEDSDNTRLLIICMKESLCSVFQDRDCTILYPCGSAPVPPETQLHIVLGNPGQINSQNGSQTYRCDNICSVSVPDLIRLFRHTCVSYESDRKGRTSSFFELYGGSDIRCLNLAGRWETERSRDHLTAYIGFGDDGETVPLDLNEKGAGPHGLIAGMTGSGKSELIITLLLSLCINYSPREFQFVMVDFKGGGAAVLFSNPRYRVHHCAGILSNLDESDTERALVSFQNECLRREQLFSSLSRITGKPVMNLSSYQSMWNESSGLPYLASLLIIVDEFAELKKEQPEVMKDLISVARVGRSLGIHMILATQKPGGIVDEQIWSNTRFRICLKVQDSSDSNEMIHKPDAARIRQSGEGYLLCDGITTHIRCGYANAPMNGMRRSVELYDAMKHIVREETFKDVSGETQAERIISEILQEQMIYPEAHQLWCEPISAVSRADLPEDPAVWIGIVDDYRNRKQSPYSLAHSTAAVFSADRKETRSFLHSVLFGILETAGRDDELYLIDDPGMFDSSVSSCGTVCGILPSRDTERTGNLLRRLEERDISSEGICSIVISDMAAFYEAAEENRIRLRSLIASAELKHLRLILCFASASVISYRDLSMIRERIALKNDSIQDLSAIFEQPVHYRITKPSHALCACPDPTDLCLLTISNEELMEKVAETASRLGTEKRFVIPAMPKRISAGDYHGNDIPLGIDIYTYRWVELTQSRKLLVLATYEEELYHYYEVMKDFPGRCRFLPDETEVHELMSQEGSWMFLTMERFLTCGLKQSSVPVLYIGTGFKDQYRFTSGYRKELRENQGILFQTGRNTVLQLIEENGR